MSAQSRSIFINLISDRPANVAKALRLGRKFLAAGWPVTLYLNLDAVAVVDPRAGLGPCPITGAPLAQQLDEFVAAGGRGLLGAECLKLAGMTPEQLPPGLATAAFPLVEELLGAEGVRVITY